MSEAAIFEFPYNLFIMERLEFVILCQDELEAKVMRIIEYQMVKLKEAWQDKATKAHEAKQPPPKEPKEYWVRLSYAQIISKLYKFDTAHHGAKYPLSISRATLRKAINSLIDKGFLLMRSKPGDEFGAPIFTLNRLVIQKAMKELPQDPYSIFGGGGSKFESGEVQNLKVGDEEIEGGEVQNLKVPLPDFESGEVQNLEVFKYNSNKSLENNENTQERVPSTQSASPAIIAAHADDAASLISLLESWRTGNAEEQRATLATLTHLIHHSSDTESHSHSSPVSTSSTADDGTAPSPIAITQAQPLLNGEEGEPIPSRHVVLTGALPGGYCFLQPFRVAVYEDVSGITVSGERGTYAFAPTEEEALAQYKVLIVDEVQWLTRKEQELSVSLREDLAYLRAHIGPSTLNPAVPASQLPVLAIGNHAENERALPPTNGTARSEVIQDEQEGTHVQKRATMTERGDSATGMQYDGNTREGVQGSATQTPTPLETQEVSRNKKSGDTSAKGKKPTQPPLQTPEQLALDERCKVLRARINEWRGYELEKKGALINERTCVRTLVERYSDKQIEAIYRYLFDEHWKWSKPDNRYKIGANEILEEAGNVAQILKERRQKATQPGAIDTTKTLGGLTYFNLERRKAEPRSAAPLRAEGAR